MLTMFCPKCGQQQVSDSMRFCSRCGVALATVADLLPTDGLITPVAIEQEPAPLSQRQKGVRQGIVILSVGLVVAFLMAVLSVFVLGSPELFVSLTAGGFFLSGLLRIMYAYLFESGKGASEIPLLETARGNPALRPQDIGSIWPARSVETAEIAEPASVTEHTTKLLKNE
jgi:hypothetical protein